jgi:hypothetical protein
MAAKLVQVRSDSLLPIGTVASRMLAVAWMSIALGIAVEIVLVINAAAFGANHDARPFIADAAQKVTWSMFICMGLALGSASAPAVRAMKMGSLGVLAAPIAFMLARIVHRSVSQGLDLDVAMGRLPIVVAIIKAVEYGCLGWAAGWLSTKPWAGIRTHAAVGFATGLTFGGTLLAFTILTASVTPPVAQIAGVALNEVIYPTGCAVILFAAGALGRQLANRVA